MSNNTNNPVVAPIPAALALIAAANQRQAAAKRQEAESALAKVTALWGRMTVSEIQEALKVNLRIMNKEEGDALKAMADEAIATLQMADQALKEHRDAIRLSTPEGVEDTMASIISQQTLDKGAAEIAKINKAREAANAAKKAKINKVIADYGDALTDNQRRAMTAFLSSPDCKWTYQPTKEGREALLRAVARAARAVREQSKK